MAAMCKYRGMYVFRLVVSGFLFSLTFYTNESLNLLVSCRLRELSRHSLFSFLARFFSFLLFLYTIFCNLFFERCFFCFYCWTAFVSLGSGSIVLKGGASKCITNTLKKIKQSNKLLNCCRVTFVR